MITVYVWNIKSNKELYCKDLFKCLETWFTEDRPPGQLGLSVIILKNAAMKIN